MGIKVYFNDSCNICRMEINHYKKIANSDLEWIDITNNDEAIKITSKSQKELLRRLHVINDGEVIGGAKAFIICLLYTSPSPRDLQGSRMPSSA